MQKTILLTGATDGIGRETAKLLAAQGHNLLIHGRSERKLSETEALLRSEHRRPNIQSYRADLSQFLAVEQLAIAVGKDHSAIDVVINNAGVFGTSAPVTEDGLDVRFMVNTIAPYLLTKRLLPLLSPASRIINLSSAAQAPVNLAALAGNDRLDDSQAYAQSKLAITMWSFHLAKQRGDAGPVIVAVNPASLLASKMVKDAYGVDGSDLRIGADILVRAALSDGFSGASGKYFDNDQGRFSQPHADALNPQKTRQLVAAIDETILKFSGNSR